MNRLVVAAREHFAPFLFFVLAMLASTTATAQVDLSVSSITQPQSGCMIGSTNNVTIRIFNYGDTLPAGTSFNVSFTINAGSPTTELVTLAAPLASNTAFGYTFTTQANLFAPVTYTFNASVSIAGDVSPGNNAYTGYTVQNEIIDAGTLTGPAVPASSGTLQLTGSSGDIVQWEESDDGGMRWYALANTGLSQDFAGLRTSTQFRVRVRGLYCGDVLSNPVTVTP
jgi:hypothetical protein